MHDIDPIWQRIEQLLQEGELYKGVRLRGGLRLFQPPPLGDIPVDL